MALTRVRFALDEERCEHCGHQLRQQREQQQQRRLDNALRAQRMREAALQACKEENAALQAKVTRLQNELKLLKKDSSSELEELKSRKRKAEAELLEDVESLALQLAKCQAELEACRAQLDQQEAGKRRSSGGSWDHAAAGQQQEQQQPQPVAQAQGQPQQQQQQEQQQQQPLQPALPGGVAEGSHGAAAQVPAAAGLAPGSAAPAPAAASGSVASGGAPSSALGTSGGAHVLAELHAGGPVAAPPAQQRPPASDSTG